MQRSFRLQLTRLEAARQKLWITDSITSPPRVATLPEAMSYMHTPERELSVLENAQSSIDGGINCSSACIVDIVGVIEGIACQINFSHSMHRSKPPGRANWAAALPRWRGKCIRWLSVVPAQPRKFVR